LAIEKRDSEVSFVCAKKENNSGLLNSAVFKLPADNGSRCSVESLNQQDDRNSSESLFIKKKLDFSRLSNPMYSLIKNEENTKVQPLTERMPLTPLIP
jgi:hypothetical protein